jgi:hypothetical protein
MDKKFIFISYASTDNDLVAILKDQILIGNSFEPIVIADQRKALKPLTQKIIDGICKSDFIIPIMTSNSFKEQWINQEIGYSISKGKTIVPIVQKEIIKELKGFIHGEIDLPYKFGSGEKLIRTSKTEFLKACKLLLSDIENETIISIEVEHIQDPIVEKAIRLKGIRDKHLSKETLIRSPDIINKFNQIVLKEIIENLELKIEKIRLETGIPFIIKTRKDKYLGIIISAESYSVSLYWEKSDRSIKDSVLVERFWEGIVPVFDRYQLPPSERDNILKKGEKIYSPDINDNLDLIWVNKTQFTSEQIINNGIDWILRSIEVKYKK